MKRFVVVTAALALSLFGLVALSASADPTAAERRADVTLKVTLPASNTGTGRVTGTGIDCPGDCEETYPQGTAVTLTPTPGPNSTFGGWTGACEGSGTECRVSGAMSAQTGAIFKSTGPPPDVTPPETTITDGPKKVKTTKKKAAVEFAFESSEADSTFECSLDDAPFAACTSPDKFKAKIGKHSFAVQATDAVGNTDASATEKSFKVVEKAN